MELQAFIDSLGLTYQATFSPKPQNFKLDRETLKSNPMLDWKIVIGRGSQKIETDYHQGIGHLPGYPQGGLKTMHDAEIAEQVFCTGRGKLGQRLNPPKLIEVLYCLVSDAEALDYPTFEQWADELGYGKDSREAERVYRACLETGLKLRAMLGDQTLTDLRLAYQ